ncbi:MAG: hypothetical protein EXQ48_09410, partial [Acidobacteria bacterium]|nr:hypothetical protein [Acidobacteriota bacterium]
MDTPVPVTGATGYIGGRLLRRFEEGGRALGCLVRQPGRLHATAPTVVVDARAADPPSAPAVFAYRSIVPGRAADVFRWHERPEALLDLIPSRRLVRIESRTGGLENGGTIFFSIGLGPVRVRWRARHYGYIRGRQFCDEQVSGPFKLWRHTHRIEPVGTAQSLYEDRVEYAVPGGRLAQRLTEPVLRRLLARAFAQRHRIVRAAMTRGLLLSLSL